MFTHEDTQATTLIVNEMELCTTVGNSWIEERMQHALDSRSHKGTKRTLPLTSSFLSAETLSSIKTNTTKRRSSREQHEEPTTCNDDDDDQIIDFSSNDYLGLAQDAEQQQLVAMMYQNESTTHNAPLGATGSRLLSGDSTYFHRLEKDLATIHNRQAALLSNSGYDANLTVVSCLPCDIILFDENIHNSLHMGIRLWQSASETPKHQHYVHNGSKNNVDSMKENSSSNTTRLIEGFQHNNVEDLRTLLQKYLTYSKRIVVLVESVYSMDGDVAPLSEILDVVAFFDAKLVVDEAHGLGIMGRTTTGPLLHLGPPGTGVLAAYDIENHPALLCSIHTFGKAAGCHGAVICGSHLFKEYLINYGYPLIYSTALPLHSLISIRCAYESMTGSKGDQARKKLLELIYLFRNELEPLLLLRDTTNTGDRVYLLPSTTPIQALVLPGNQTCTEFCNLLYSESKKRIHLFPIKSPTVPTGQERIRIVLHAHNTPSQVNQLVHLILATLNEIQIRPTVLSRL